jgi:hypothetical protein
VKIKERGIDVDKLDRGGFSTKFFGASGVNHFVLMFKGVIIKLYTGQ